MPFRSELKFLAVRSTHILIMYYKLEKMTIFKQFFLLSVIDRFCTHTTVIQCIRWSWNDFVALKIEGDDPPVFVWIFHSYISFIYWQLQNSREVLANSSLKLIEATRNIFAVLILEIRLIYRKPCIERRKKLIIFYSILN